MNKNNNTCYYKKLSKKPNIFRRLTGISPEKFEEVSKELEPKYNQWNTKRLSQRKRQRKVGGGNQPKLCFSDRLLLLLMYYRTYSTCAFLGWIFGLDESNVGRNFKPLEPLLAQIFKIPERKIKLSEDEIAELFFDGTEQDRERPSKKQKRYYSGKKKRHTVKHQIVVVKKKKGPGRGKKKRKLRIAAVSKAYGGRVHDKNIYDETKIHKPHGVKGKGDSGYQGTILHIPHKKSRGKELTPKQKQANKRHSALRICVEHGIGKMKIWRIAKDRFRHCKMNHTLIMKNIAGLHNLMFA